MAAAKSVLDKGTVQTVFASLVEQAAAVNALALAAAGVSISGPLQRGRKAGKKRGARGNGSPQHGDALRLVTTVESLAVDLTAQITAHNTSIRAMNQNTARIDARFDALEAQQSDHQTRLHALEAKAALPAAPPQSQPALGEITNATLMQRCDVLETELGACNTAMAAMQGTLDMLIAKQPELDNSKKKGWGKWWKWSG
jgi:chromosome segregation ATPase